LGENLEIPGPGIPSGKQGLGEREAWPNKAAQGWETAGGAVCQAGGAHEGEGGLMGLALHPEFPGKPYLYAMHTYRREGNLFNRVVRLRDLGEQGVFDKSL